MSPLSFTHNAFAMRVIFGAGRISELNMEVERLGLSRVIVVCTATKVKTGELLSNLLGSRCCAVYPRAVMHVPHGIVDQACEYVQEEAVDGCVAVGGGSSIGLAKAIALRTKIPILAVPTTYAGSEMTPIWGITTAAGKAIGRHPDVLPRSVLYDPELTLTLPPAASAVSGINALAHAAEALYAPDISPISDAMATEAARLLYTALPTVVGNPVDIASRNTALCGAWLAGACLAITTMSLHHKLCHIIGGAFNLPHAETHAVILPRVLEYNLPASTHAFGALSTALNHPDPVAATYAVISDLGAPQSLRDLGMPKAAVDRVLKEALAKPYANPRTVDETSLGSVLQAAYWGTRNCAFGD